MSSITVLQAFLWEKLSVYDKNRKYKPTKEKIWISNKFFHEFPPKRWFTNGINSLINEMMQEGAFAHTAHEQ